MRPARRSTRLHPWLEGMALFRIIFRKDTQVLALGLGMLVVAISGIVTLVSGIRTQMVDEARTRRPARHDAQGAPKEFGAGDAPFGGSPD